MKKKIIYLGLCAILVWGALVFWNWAPLFAIKFGCSHIWFDLLAGVLGLGAIALSCAASGETKIERR